MAKALNFNSWIKGMAMTPGTLPSLWEPKRGRMTRDSVEKRALGYGMAPGVGAWHWDAFMQGVTITEA